jgi:hypothetical protein
MTRRANSAGPYNKEAQAGYWPEDMPEDIIEARLYAPAGELVRATLVAPCDAAAVGTDVYVSTGHRTHFDTLILDYNGIL